MGTNYDSLGWAEMIQGAPVAHGSWHGDNTNYKANHHRIRGGTTIIPDYFANTYLGGRRLGVGFGGNYSGNAYCSQGPYLAAAMPPTDGVPQLDTITLINHPSSNRAHRNPDYYWTPATPGNPPNPSGGVGYWSWTDEIFGAGCWIDLPDKHGLVIMPSLGHGHLKYWQAGTRWSEWKSIA